jgi:nickel-dependent lactate racemase
MTPAQIKAAIKRPVGSPTIRELAKDRREVVIIFDDMSRITRAAKIVPFILEELAAAGVPDSQIRFIAALGCHGALNRADFVRKLGEAVVARFPVYNHTSFDAGCTYVGTTTRGIRVCANNEVMKCDLKIGIGSIEPHIMAGFGGGAKIVLPGVTSLATNEALHKLGARMRQEHPELPMGIGIYPGNPMREEMDEAAAMVGLNIKVDCLFNMWGETTHIFCGNPRDTFAAGVPVAKNHYLSPRATEKDIVIANTFAKVNEPESGITTGMPSVTSRGGDLVLVYNAPEGHVIHFLFGGFGIRAGGIISLKFRLPDHINRLIVFNEYPDPTFGGSFEPAGKVILVDKWEKVLELLGEGNRNKDKVKVAVYPSSEVQYCAPAAG